MEISHAITNAGSQLTKFLQILLKRELSFEAEHIGLGVPGEDNNLSVCIYLYDIKKNTDMIFHKMVPVDEHTSRYPSMYYDLYYMIIPYSKSDMKYRAYEEQKCLDIMLQSFNDAFFLEDISFENNMLVGESETKLEVWDMEYEEKTKIWTCLNQPYKLSLFIKAGPIEVRSGRSKQIKRVEEVQIAFHEKSNVL